MEKGRDRKPLGSVAKFQSGPGKASHGIVLTLERAVLVSYLATPRQGLDEPAHYVTDDAKKAESLHFGVIDGLDHVS